MRYFHHRVSRRRFLQATSAGIAGSLATWPPTAYAAEPAIQLDSEHQKAVNRRRRIVVQYDAQTAYGIDFNSWLDYRFAYIDQPGSQIDSVFWDIGRLGQVLYPSKFLDLLQNSELQKWRDQGIDMAGRLIEATKKRGLEVFWHHRFSEVDINTAGTGAAWKDGPAPLKQAHPNRVLQSPQSRGVASSPQSAASPCPVPDARNWGQEPGQLMNLDSPLIGPVRQDIRTSGASPWRSKRPAQSPRPGGASDHCQGRKPLEGGRPKAISAPEGNAVNDFM